MKALLMNCKIFSWFLFANQQDVVTALPNQVTKIRMLFDRPGRYVWHCHILSHEDHEMMRVLQVGPE
jgi:FtsP/CotA-like multicopper oxidase with cupredoxin domain